MSKPMDSFLEVVQDCDNFPYPEDPVYDNRTSTLWKFFLPDDDRPHGLLTDDVVHAMPWTPDFDIITKPEKQVRLCRPVGPDWQPRCTQILAHQMNRARELGVFPQLGRTRGEMFPIVGARFPVAIDRSEFSMWGIIGQGVHMTVYTRTAAVYQFWIPQRNPNKKTYPGLLDNAVAGGMAIGETPWQCLVREAEEEAGMTANRVQSDARAAGTVTWLNVSDVRASGPVGLINPGVLFVYDMELREEEVLRPVDQDIWQFHHMGVESVKQALLEGRFKPSSGAVMLDFLIRHGLLTAEQEPEYAEIVARLHRKLPLPYCSYRYRVIYVVPSTSLSRVHHARPTTTQCYDARLLILGQTRNVQEASLESREDFPPLSDLLHAAVDPRNHSPFKAFQHLRKLRLVSHLGDYPSVALFWANDVGHVFRPPALEDLTLYGIGASMADRLWWNGEGQSPIQELNITIGMWPESTVTGSDIATILQQPKMLKRLNAYFSQTRMPHGVFVESLWDGLFQHPDTLESLVIETSFPEWID